MTLWEIDGETLVSDFGTDGVLTINSSNPVLIPATTVTLPAGRYITEIRLINESEDVAVYREVTEIWPGLTTRIVFEPEDTDYGNPNAELDLATSTIGGMAVSAGTDGGGDGASEADAVKYLLIIGDTFMNAAINLVPTDASLSAAVSWVQNTGDFPNDVYPNTGTTAAGLDFSSDKVLWGRVVSQDTTNTKYYRFTLAAHDFTVSGGDSYSWGESSGVKTMTITGTGNYAISMEPGLAATTGTRIIVASGVTANITLDSVNIDMSKKSAPAFEIASGATVNLTLSGDSALKGGSTKAGIAAPAGAALTITEASTGSLTATGGNGSAGIGGGGSTINGGAITISGGTVNATGGSGGAGIGGGSSSSGGSGGAITISGGEVTATGGSGGAGIGGGLKGSGGNITISGGLITATGTANGIGGGTNNTTTGTITALSGNAVVFASSIGPSLPADKLAIVFINTAGTMYGNVTLEQDVEIPSTHTLALSSGQTLTIPAGKTLTNNGTITKNGGDIDGTVSGDGAVND
jgi:hypothetical protein